MINNFHNLYSSPRNSDLSAHVKLGIASFLLAHSKRQNRYPIDYLLRVVWPAITQDNIHIYFNSEGLPVCFVIWARLTEKVAERYVERGFPDFHISEWNEGGELWIVDIAVPFGHFHKLFNELRDTFFRNEISIKYLRRKIGRIKKVFFYREARKYLAKYPVNLQRCACGNASCKFVSTPILFSQAYANS